MIERFVRSFLDVNITFFRKPQVFASLELAYAHARYFLISHLKNRFFDLHVKSKSQSKSLARSTKFSSHGRLFFTYRSLNNVLALLLLAFTSPSDLKIASSWLVTHTSCLPFGSFFDLVTLVLNATASLRILNFKGAKMTLGSVRIADQILMSQTNVYFELERFRWFPSAKLACI